MKLLSKETMEKLTTERLLAYRNALLSVHEGPNWDWEWNEKLNKQSTEWKETYNTLKDILKTRPHVPKEGVSSRWPVLEKYPINATHGGPGSYARFLKVVDKYRDEAKKVKTILVTREGLEDYRNGKMKKLAGGWEEAIRLMQ